MALKWTKTSGPLSGVMNPKPLSALNHFTVPIVMSNSLLSVAGPASLRSGASGMVPGKGNCSKPYDDAAPFDPYNPARPAIFPAVQGRNVRIVTVSPI